MKVKIKNYNSYLDLKIPLDKNSNTHLFCVVKYKIFGF